MFELSPEPAFSSWFESLSEPAAEDVSAALEVLARAGGVLEPSRVSRALLYYDAVNGRELAVENGEWQSLVASHSARALGGLLAWQREILGCLESEAFGARLARLTPESAQQALVLVERLKARLRAWQREVLLEFGARRADANRLVQRHAELAHAFAEALASVGLSNDEPLRRQSGLRELTLERQEPKLRVLFGLDAERERLLLISGEALTRRYYGDSVRFAEERWARYRARKLAASQPGRP